MIIQTRNRKCPKCGLITQVVSTELLCSGCGVIDFSEERLKEAERVNIRLRIVPGIFLFSMILSMLVFVRVYPDLYKAYSSIIDFVFFYSVLTIALITNIYAFWKLKKLFPEVKIE